MSSLLRVSIPSPATAPLTETNRINAQRAAAAGNCGDFCQLGAGGWSPTATAAPALRLVLVGGFGTTPGIASFGAGTSVTPLNPGVRINYAVVGSTQTAAVTPGTLYYLDAGAAGGLNDTSNGAPLARALANSKGVFEGVIELL